MRSLLAAAVALICAVNWSCKSPGDVEAQAGSETKDWLVTSGDWVMKGTLNYPPHLDYKKIKISVDINYSKSALTATGETTTGEEKIKGVIEPTGDGVGTITFDFKPVRDRYTLPTFSMETARHRITAAYHGQGDQTTGRAYEYANPPSGTYTNANFMSQMDAIRKELAEITFIEVPELSIPMTAKLQTVDGKSANFYDLRSYVTSAPTPFDGNIVQFWKVESDDKTRVCEFGMQAGDAKPVGDKLVFKPAMVVCTHGQFGLDNVQGEIGVRAHARMNTSLIFQDCRKFKGTLESVAGEMNTNGFTQSIKVDRTLTTSGCSYIN